MSGGVLVVGGSVGGIRTARALRNEGYAGAVTVVEAEPHLPYDKPPLSKVPLDGDAHVPLLTAAEARELDIELRLGAVAIEVRAQANQLALADGTVLDYDELVIATGAAARPSPWSGPGIHVLRTLADARALRESLHGANRLLVVGAGFIGAEIASLARKQGIDVTIVDPAPVPMARIVGTELGERLSDLHRVHGVEAKFGTTVSALDCVDDSLRATLSDGSEFPVDAVVVGIGAVLELGWLESSGLTLDDGVVCDEYGRTPDFANIHAVGDISKWYQPRLGTSARVEHWTNAVEQANTLAHNIVHSDDLLAHDPVAYVWSDQYDWKIQLFGTRDVAADPLVVEQSDPLRLAAIWQDSEGRASGGFTVNWPKASVQLRRTIAAGGPADAVHAQLSTPAVKR